jgi:hypothetical protein
MVKNTTICIRVTRSERRALNRFARLRKMAVAQLIRQQVIEAAMKEDPRQKHLALANLGGPPV